MGKNKYGKSYKRSKKGSSGRRQGGAPIRGGKVRASHILVDKLSTAYDLKKQIDKGADFKKLARENSKCPSKKRGGDLGAFSKGKMVAPFWNATVKLNLNEISNPVKTEFGYHLIMRTE